VSRHSLPAWQSAFLLLERVALRAGEGGCCLGLPPHGAPPSNPRRQPRWLSYLLGPRSGPVDFCEKSTGPQAARQAPPRPSFELGTYLKAACKPSVSGRRASHHRSVGQGFQPPMAGQGRERPPVWQTDEEPGAAVRVTRRPKEKRRSEGLGGRQLLPNGTRC